MLSPNFLVNSRCCRRVPLSISSATCSTTTMSSSPLSSPPPSSPAFESQFPVPDDTIVVEDYPLVISRLRSKKRKAVTPPPPATTRRRGRQRNRRRNSSSPLPMSSLYRIRTPVPGHLEAHFVSSPYAYDHEFYDNGPFGNKGLDEKAVTYRAAHNRHKKHMRKAHEDIINSAKLKPFRPLSMPDPPRLIRSYLLPSCQVDNPASYFAYFIR